MRDKIRLRAIGGRERQNKTRRRGEEDRRRQDEDKAECTGTGVSGNCWAIYTGEMLTLLQAGPDRTAPDFIPQYRSNSD